MSAIVDGALEVLRDARIPLRPGLTRAELGEVEDRFGVEFSPDHAEFLQRVTPQGERWVDWLHGDEEAIRGRLDWPIDSALFDVENGAFWHPSWGARPATRKAALADARAHLEAAPRLIPLFSHRFMPSAPAPPGSPVFSVWQTDVIYYGSDLAGYFRSEFGPTGWDVGETPVEVDFWSELALGEDYTLPW